MALKVLQLRSCSVVGLDGAVRAVQAAPRLERLEVAGPGALAGLCGRELRRRLQGSRPDVEVAVRMPHGHM